jgi:hypothetical protein
MDTVQNNPKEKFAWPSEAEILAALMQLKSKQEGSNRKLNVDDIYSKHMPTSMEKDGKWFFGGLTLGLWCSQKEQHVRLVVISDWTDVERQDLNQVLFAISQLVPESARNPVSYHVSYYRRYFLGDNLRNDRVVFEWDNDPAWVIFRKREAKISCLIKNCRMWEISED